MHELVTTVGILVVLGVIFAAGTWWAMTEIVRLVAGSFEA